MEYLTWVEKGCKPSLGEIGVWIAAINCVAEIEKNEADGTASELMLRGKAHAIATLAVCHATSLIN